MSESPLPKANSFDDADRPIDAALPEDADSKLVGSIAAIGIVCALLLGSQAAVTGRYIVGIAIIVIAIAISINLFLAARRPVSFLQLNITLFVVTLAMTAAILMAGSPTPSSLILLALVPFIMGALGNRRWTTLWLVITLLSLVGFYLHAPYALTHYVEPAPNQTALHYLHVTVLAVFITVTGYVLMGKRHAFLNALESANRELIRARNEANAASELKSEFLGRMSHELRTPLNAILGFTEVMAADKDAPLTAGQIQRLSHIQVSGHRLLDIVDEILQITTHDTRRSFMVLLPTPLAPVIADAVNAAAATGLRNGVSISVDASSFKATQVLSEQKALGRVFSELIENAIKFNRPGGSVRIGVDDNLEYAKISVSDTGIGIPESAIPELFEPFNQLHPRETGRTGAGLGLTMARALAVSMNGTIEVTSKIGAGSTFTLILPIYLPTNLGTDVATVTPNDSLPNEQETNQLQNAIQSYEVLYVEDNPLNQLVMRAMFDELDRGTLLIAENGSEGLQQALTRVPRLLLIDIHLPDCSGVELLARIRTYPSLAHIPAVAVSADAMPENINAALSAGFADYLVKPISLQALNEALERQKRKTRQQ